MRLPNNTTLRLHGQSAGVLAQPARSPADLNADRRTDFLLYNRTTGVWVQARTSASGFDFISGTWDPNWTIQAGDFAGDRDDDLFLYNNATGVWVEALVEARGALTYLVLIEDLRSQIRLVAEVQAAHGEKLDRVKSVYEKLHVHTRLEAVTKLGQV